MPSLAATVAVVGPSHVVLVHVDAHVPKVLEAVVHGHPLRGLALACESSRQDYYHRNEGLDVGIYRCVGKRKRKGKLTLDPNGKFAFLGPLALSGFGGWDHLEGFRSVRSFQTSPGMVLNELVLLVTHHILVLPAEALDGISDVLVPLEAFVAVVALGGVPGEGALD